jgi:hypothetical protein
MKQYHKIQTIYHRKPETNFKELMEGVWAMPEFEILKDITWVWTEKIDGTNIRVMWNGSQVTFGGKTDAAQIPAALVKVLEETFTADKMKTCFAEGGEICLYGEGYGNRIQDGKNYLTNGVNFILFDCWIDGFWLTRENLEDIAAKLNIGIVPIMGTGTLLAAVEFARKGYYSTIAENKAYMAEGLIMKPQVELLNRRGHRIITKIKYRDFKK